MQRIVMDSSYGLFAAVKMGDFSGVLVTIFRRARTQVQREVGRAELFLGLASLCFVLPNVNLKVGKP
ncbi:MAG: hypothetical protein ACJAZ9_001983 [Neolewinella sp.]|jgi:hypothetical protein